MCTPTGCSTDGSPRARPLVAGARAAARLRRAGDWTEFAKRVQLKVIDILLRSSDTAAMENAKQFVLEECRTLLNAPIEEIKDYLIQYAPISRSPEKYKSITPAVGAFLHYCEVNNLDPKKEWKNISKFPYIILKCEGPQYKRARHPNLMNSTEIDREQYIKEVLGAVSTPHAKRLMTRSELAVTSKTPSRMY